MERFNLTQFKIKELNLNRFESLNQFVQVCRSLLSTFSLQLTDPYCHSSESQVDIFFNFTKYIWYYAKMPRFLISVDFYPKNFNSDIQSSIHVHAYT